MSSESQDEWRQGATSPLPKIRIPPLGPRPEKKMTQASSACNKTLAHRARACNLMHCVVILFVYIFNVAINVIVSQVVFLPAYIGTCYDRV